MIKFRCSVADNCHGRIDAIAHELDAEVDYVGAPFGILAVLGEDGCLGCVRVLGKDFWQLRKDVLEVLNARGDVENAPRVAADIVGA